MAQVAETILTDYVHRENTKQTNRKKVKIDKIQNEKQSIYP